MEAEGKNKPINRRSIVFRRWTLLVLDNIVPLLVVCVLIISPFPEIKEMLAVIHHHSVDHSHERGDHDDSHREDEWSRRRKRHR